MPSKAQKAAAAAAQFSASIATTDDLATFRATIKSIASKPHDLLWIRWQVYSG